MRVAQIIDSLRVAGGAEQLQRVFAEAVASSDVEISVLTLRRGEPAAVSALESLGVRVVAFPSRKFASPLRAARLLRFLRRSSFDVVHTHLVRSTVLGLPAARAAGVPSVATLHNTRYEGMPAALREAERLLLRHAADRVVAVGWETARAHRSRLGDRTIDVIPNAVGDPCSLSATERAALRRELGVEEGQRLILAVGRLDPQKAFPALLHAIETLVAERQDVQLRIAGRGPLAEELEADVQRRGLQRSVRLLGLRHDVPRLLAASDLYVSSSAWEGLPVATLEAMATGLPVVATAVGDVTRLVDASCGILVPPGQPAELARALARVLDEPGLGRSLGEAARMHVRLHHGAEAWSRRLLALYEELAARQPGEARRATGDSPCA